MRILEGLMQGSPEWLAARLVRRTASEAAAMFNVSPYMTRDELLAMKATGITKEVDEYTQARFDEGHATEAAQRPLTEEDILDGDELYPVVGVHDEFDWLLASLDGFNYLTSADTLFEHKLWNELLAEQVRRGELEPAYFWQLEQQLLVSGAERVIFVVSDGTRENRVWMEYRAVAGRADQLIEGWRQFDRELATWEPPQRIAQVVANPIASMPALIIEVKGEVVTSNLAAYRIAADKVFAGLKKDLQTDQDFEDAKASIAFCKESAAKLRLTKDQTMAKMVTVNDAVTTLEYLAEQFDKHGRDYQNLVTTRNTSLKEEIVHAAVIDYRNHIDAINTRLGAIYVTAGTPACAADFAGQVKGKRSFDNMRSAVKAELARVIVASNMVSNELEKSLRYYNEHGLPHAGLFRDLAIIIHKPYDDFVLIVKSRLDEQKAEGDRQRAADAARLQREADERAEAEAARKNEMWLQAISGIQQQATIACIGLPGVRQGGTIDCIRETLAETEAWVIDADQFGLLVPVAQQAKDKAVADIRALLATAEADAAAPLPAPVPAPAPAPAPVQPAAQVKEERVAFSSPVLSRMVSDALPYRAPAGTSADNEPTGNVVNMPSAKPAATSSSPPTLKLGDINTRLHPYLSTSEAGLAALGFTATKVKGACLYHETDWGRMCDSFVAQIRTAQHQKQAA